MKKITQILISVLSLGLILVAFQNCGESLDLSEIQAASTAPSATILTSSPAMLENNSYQFDLQILNMSNYTIQWWKDGTQLEGFDGKSLIFEPAKLDDAGEYHAVIQLDANTQILTDPITVTVAPDQTLTSYAFPRVVSNNQNYFLRIGSVAQNESTADAYCKHELGPNAISTGYVQNAMIDNTNYTARAEDQAACVNLPYINGMCLRFDPGEFEPELRDFIGPFVRRFASVECRPEPIELLGE